MEDPKPAEVAGDIPPTYSDGEGNVNNHHKLGGDAEKRLIRKLDLHIIPVVMLLYLLSFLDRCVFYCCETDQ